MQSPFDKLRSAIRPQKLTVKNALFAGSDGGARHWAIMASLIETCKLCAVEPFAYLRDTLTRITAGHTINRIGELAPWNYKPVAGAAATRHPFQADAHILDTPPSILPAQ